MIKCAVYARVSTKTEEQQLSLENQKHLFEDYAAKKGWIIYKVYDDVGTGTKSKNRPGFNEMLKDLNENKFEIILFKDISRIARNSLIAHQLKELVDNNKVHLVSLDNLINSLNGNMYMFSIIAMIAEAESQNTSTRVKSIFKHKACRGLVTGGHPPYGYSLSKNKLYVKKDNSPDIIKRIYKAYIDGHGFDRIARDLYEEGIPTPSMVAGKSNGSDKWHGSSIKLILQNEAYIGNLVQSRESTRSVTSTKRYRKPEADIIRVTNTHEPIIDKEVFTTVQNLIQERKHQKYHQRVHLFTNIIFCADCNKGMHFKKHRKGYICGNFNKYGKKACTDHIVREDELKTYILNDIRSFINAINDDKIFSNFEKLINERKKKFALSLKSIENKIESLINKKTKAIYLLVDNAMTKEDYNFFMTNLSKEIDTLEKEKNSILISMEKVDTKSLMNELKKIKDECLDLKELTPEILHRFVSKVQIKENGDAVVTYRFSELQSIFR